MPAGSARDHNVPNPRAADSGLTEPGLADVERGAAAEGDDSVMAAGGKGCDAAVEVGAGRIGPDFTKQSRRDSRLRIAFKRFADHRQSGEAAIGDQQRPRHAELAAGLRQLGDAAGSSGLWSDSSSWRGVGPGPHIRALPDG
jgi:hypothetical protein